MQEVADVLLQERRSLELLLYRLTVVRALLSDREEQFLGWSSSEVERARQHVREIDLLRSANVSLLGVRGSKRTAPTLRQLASLAGDPWSSILRDHHDALTRLVADIEVTTYQAAESARAAIRSVAEAQAMLDLENQEAKSVSVKSSSGGYLEGKPAGKPPQLSTWRPLSFRDDAVPDDRDLMLLTREKAYQDALSAAGKLQIPSLIAFLR